jgi:acetyl esterase/lipase
MNDQDVSVEHISDAQHPTLQGDLFVPSRPNGWGALVLAGSSGRLDLHAARLLANGGAIAFAQRWFREPDLPSEIRDVPLELFMAGIDLLESKGCSRIALLGRSRGAEAALLVAVNDRRAHAVFAISPSSVAWAGSGLDGRPSWTLGGKEIPFVPYDLSFWGELPREGGLVRYRDLYERSLRNDPGVTERAFIQVERMRAKLILVAGEADALWPSDTFARALVQRLRDHGQASTLLLHPDAGHRILLPGDTTPRSQLHAHGGSDRADIELGEAAWRAIVECMYGAGL